MTFPNKPPVDWSNNNTAYNCELTLLDQSAGGPQEQYYVRKDLTAWLHVDSAGDLIYVDVHMPIANGATSSMRFWRQGHPDILHGEEPWRVIYTDYFGSPVGANWQTSVGYYQPEENGIGNLDHWNEEADTSFDWLVPTPGTADGSVGGYNLTFRMIASHQQGGDAFGTATFYIKGLQWDGTQYDPKDNGGPS